MAQGPQLIMPEATGGESARRGHFRLNLRWWLLYVVLFGVAACWQIATPFGIGPDESNQMIRAAEVVRGEVFSPTVPNGNGLMWQAHLPAEYGKVMFTQQCFANQRDVPASCASIPKHGPASLTWTPFGTYPIPYYAMVGWPTLLPDIRWGDLLTHLLSAAICAALLASAFCSALESRRRGMVLGLMVAATSAVLYHLGTINPSALTIAAATCTASTLALIAISAGPPTRRQCVRTAMAASLLAVARPDSPLWLGTIVVVCAVLAGRSRIVELARLRRVQVAAGVACVATLAAAGWAIHADYPHTTAWTADHILHVPFSTAFTQSLRLFPIRAQEMLSAPGTRELFLPAGVEIAFLAVLTGLVVTGFVAGRWRERAALALALPAAVLLPAVVEALGVNLTGYFWQGRYSLPIAVLVPIVASLAADHALRGAAVRRITAGALAGFVAAVQLAAFYLSLHRFAVGNAAPLNHLSGAGSWAPPVISAKWLVLIFLALDVALLAVLWTRRRAEVLTPAEARFDLNGMANRRSAVPAEAAADGITR